MQVGPAIRHKRPHGRQASRGQWTGTCPGERRESACRREAVGGDSCGAREEGIWMATGIRVRAPCTGRATDEKQKQEKKWQDSYWVGPRTPEREGRGRWRRRTKQGGRRAAGRRGGPSTGQGHPGGAAAAPLPFPGPGPTHYFASERPDCPQDARGPQCAGEADVLLGGRVSFHLGEVSISTGHSAMQRESPVPFTDEEIQKKEDVSNSAC